MNSYDNFIDSYAVELKKVITDFKSLDVKAITDEDIDKAYARVDNIYDKGVADHLTGFLTDRKELSIRVLADIAHNNMNRYGTEMRQILNAAEDFIGELSDFLPEEEN